MCVGYQNMLNPKPDHGHVLETDELMHNGLLQGYRHSQYQLLGCLGWHKRWRDRTAVHFVFFDAVVSLLPLHLNF